MCQSLGNSSMCSGMQQVKKVTYEPSSEPFLIISRSILQEYLMCECIFFLSLIPIAYLLISVMTLPYGRTESGIQKCVCWSPTFKKLFLLDTWQIGKNNKKGHYCFFSAEKVLRLRSPPGLVF